MRAAIPSGIAGRFAMAQTFLNADDFFDMTRTLARTPLHSSSFVRVLADLVELDAEESRAAFAEKLAQWIHIADAITLRAAHNATAPTPADTSGVKPSEAASHVRAAFTHARAALEKTLQAGADSNSKPGATRTSLPRPKRGTPAELAGSYEPYKRYYVAHQREMELKIKPLRAKVRSAVAELSPTLQQLTALDAAFEGILQEREAMLLAKVPTLLERRFKQLRKTHQDARAQTGLEDNPDLWMQADGWLTRFGQEMQSVLLAELDLRLQPTVGLMEALDNEIPTFS